MKILIAYQYLSFRGGIEEVILESSKYLKQAGNSVEIVTFRFSKKDHSTTKYGIPVYRLPSLNFTYKYLGIPFAIPLLLPHKFKKLYNLIKSCDVINIHGHPYLASLVFVLIAKALKKPILLTQHNTRIVSPSKLVNSIYDTVDKTYGKYILEASDQIFCGSHQTLEYLNTISKKLKGKLHVLYNGVNPEKFKPAADKENLKKQLGVKTGIFTALTIRRITFKNGIDTLLKTAEQLNSKKVQILVGGTGADMHKVKAYLENKNITNVTLLGFVKDEDLPKFYALADCFILPSRKGEGFPMAVLEAFSSGLPVVATDSGGHTEIIKDDETGYVVPVESDKEIAARVQKLSENKQLVETMSIKVRKFIEDSISWEKYTETFLTIAKKITHGTKK